MPIRIDTCVVLKVHEKVQGTRENDLLLVRRKKKSVINWPYIISSPIILCVLFPSNVYENDEASYKIYSIICLNVHLQKSNKKLVLNACNGLLSCYYSHNFSFGYVICMKVNTYSQKFLIKFNNFKVVRQSKSIF